MIRTICHYIINLSKETHVSVSDIETIGIDNSTIRIAWGGQYFDFSYDRHNFHPVEGKSSLLDGNIPKICIKPYSCKEFLELMEDADQLIAFSNKSGLLFTPNAEYRSSHRPNLGFFHLVKIYQYTDYDSIITDLEYRGLLSVRSSCNLIATIDKKFEITPQAIQLIPVLKEYGNHFYEADCLGTKIHEELTTHIQDLWRLSSKN